MISKNRMDLFKIEIQAGKEINPQKFFLLELNNHYSSYQKKWNGENDEWKEFWQNTNKQNKSINPEKQSIKSPLTILHGPWGSGKTFFIEELVRQWDQIICDEAVVFKNIVVIDLWEYIHSDTNIILELSQHFCEIIYNFLPIKQRRQIIKKKFKKLLKDELFSALNKNKYLKWFFKSSKIFWPEKYKKSSPRKELENYVKDLDPTIVVFDNIERLEHKVVEIVKVIQFFSFLPNFIFILPMNKSAVKFANYQSNEEEDSIDKYITLDVWFEYKQNYSNLLRKNSFPEEYISELNDQLNTPQKNENDIGYVLTIRELEKALQINNLKTELINIMEKNKYEGFYSFGQLIWPNIILEKDVVSFMVEFRSINSKMRQTKEFLFISNFAKEFDAFQGQKWDRFKKNYAFLFAKLKEFICVGFELFESNFNELKEDIEILINKRVDQSKKLDEFKNHLDSWTNILKQNIEHDIVQKYWINKKGYFKWEDFLVIWDWAKELILKHKNDNSVIMREFNINFQTPLKNYIFNKLNEFFKNHFNKN